VFYCGLAFILCYVFRGFCQDPALEEDSWERQLEKAAEVKKAQE